MSKLFVYLSFIPWLIYFSSICNNAIKDLKKNKINKTWLKNNIFKIFHFQNIILFGIFVYFSIYYYKAKQIWLVEILLFAAINLYLYINHYYDKNNSDEQLSSSDLPTILIILLLVMIPIIFYISTKNRLVTYFILFGYSFFNYLIVYVAAFIHKKLLDIFSKQNGHK